MNVRDSQWLGAMLRLRGFEEAPLSEAEAIILNTCSVREKPERKVRATLRRIWEETGRDPLRLVAVAGCVAQQLGAALHVASPQTRLVAGADGINELPDAIEELLQEPDKRLAMLDFIPAYAERPLDAAHDPSAYVNIMRGCDNFCSYCIVPFTRGRQKSRPSEAILSECRTRLAEGTLELTLLGQNVNAYGKDLPAGKAAFHDLLSQVARLPGLERLRYVSAHPCDMDDAAVGAFAEFPALCPALHLPLQSGSGAILKAMHRRHTPDDYLRLVNKLRSARPDIALSADIIVGFPGETEADFQDTLSLMREVRFVSSFSFRYSDRPGTRASLMPDKIAEEVKQDRLAHLQALQEELGSAWLASRVGQTVPVLLERPSARQTGGNSWQGRDAHGATVNIPLGKSVSHAGALVEARITASKHHSLAGEFIRFIRKAPLAY